MGTPSDCCLHGAPPTIELAVQFVVRESAGLEAAVRAPRDPAVVGDALGWHDHAHRPWLSLLATCRYAGWPSARPLARLYGYHGRLVELLELGLVADPHTGAVLADRLGCLTRQAVDGLRADAASHARGGCHRRAAHTPATVAGTTTTAND